MNSRFAVAVHILTVIAHHGGAPVTSETIAASVNTNPSLIRRLLGQLARAGLATSQRGAGGGALLGRPAERITLCDVYRAVTEAEVFRLHERPDPRCPVGRCIQALLTERFGEATDALQHTLARTTLADMLAGVDRAGSGSGRLAS